MPPPLVACPSCACHVRASETACVPCGEPLRQRDGTVPRTAVAVLLGLAVAGAAGCDGCSPKPRFESVSAPPYGVAAPAYGIAATDMPVESPPPAPQRRDGGR